MSTVVSQKRWQGISDYIKESANNQIPDTYYFGRAVNYRDDPQAITLLPAAIKDSDSQVIDLLKWGDLVPVTLTSFYYGNAGNFYQRTSSGVWSNLHKVPSSHGNGLAYFSGDDYVYYMSDSSFGRYGPTQNSPSFTDNYIASQGGVPTNTASILLASASSQYATAADSASLSITGNLTLETFFKANSLPAVGSSMTLIGKWDESTNIRSYKLDLFGVSGYFGDGSDGALTISANTTESPIDSACTGTSGTQALSATNVSFAAGQVIIIHQSKGTNAGQWERNTIQGYSAGTITLGTPLLGSYGSGAQVRVLKQYTNVTVNITRVYTGKAWNGTTGGIGVSFLASGTLSNAGTIDYGSLGFAGGVGVQHGNGGFQGDSATGTGGQIQAANGAGGGGGQASLGGGGGGGGNNASGGAGGNNTNGASGTNGTSDPAASIVFGGGGGGGNGGSGSGGNGGAGGGIGFISAVTITNTGTISFDGAAGASGTDAGGGGGGAGSGVIKAQTATLGAGLIHANGGAGGVSTETGGAGGSGKLHLDYLTSFTGTTTPTLTSVQDNTLVTTTTIQARLGISNDGTSFEYLTQNLTGLTTATWNRLSVSWVASTSTASFYLNAALLGTFTGTKTAINDNASLLYVGNNKTSVLANYFDGLLNDMRIWNNSQSATQIAANYLKQIPVGSSGLAAYFKFNSNPNDSTANANNLTLVNTPTYSSDVPFAGATTRLDIDTQNTNTGNLYTLLTSISENAVDKLSFTPINDPQASVGFYVDTKGTGTWTLTVHDTQNRVIATSSIATASIPSSGFVEFVFTTPWRILINKGYHMHLTVSTGTSKVVTGTASDFSTAEYATYFGILVSDTQFHPAIQFQYQPLGGVLTGAIVIGNERYLAIWDGVNYSPNFIAFPPAWRVRCFAFWREFLAIGMWRGGNIYDFDRGRIYFWDGISPTFNFFIDVPEGQINAMFGVDSDLYIFAGYRGILLDYQGGYFYNTGNTKSNKLKRMPLMAPTDYGEVYPSALTMWRGMLHFGLYANSNSTEFERGVYSYGSLNQFYPDTLSYDYLISTGNNFASATIGLVMGLGTKLIIGWQDGITFGADVVDFLNNPPAFSGSLEMLIRDDGQIWKSSANFQVRADHLPLNTSEEVSVGYKIDRASDYTVLPSNNTTVDSEFTKIVIGEGRGREIQLIVELVSNFVSSPTLLGLSLQHDTLSEESLF